MDISRLYSLPKVGIDPGILCNSSISNTSFRHTPGANPMTLKFQVKFTRRILLMFKSNFKEFGRVSMNNLGKSIPQEWLLWSILKKNECVGQAAVTCYYMCTSAPHCTTVIMLVYNNDPWSRALSSFKYPRKAPSSGNQYEPTSRRCIKTELARTSLLEQSQATGAA